jgi:hypothetical protein
MKDRFGEDDPLVFQWCSEVEARASFEFAHPSKLPPQEGNANRVATSQRHGNYFAQTRRVLRREPTARFAPGQARRLG